MRFAWVPLLALLGLVFGAIGIALDAETITGSLTALPNASGGDFDLSGTDWRLTGRTTLYAPAGPWRAGDQADFSLVWTGSEAALTGAEIGGITYPGLSPGDNATPYGSWLNLDTPLLSVGYGSFDLPLAASGHIGVGTRNACLLCTDVTGAGFLRVTIGGSDGALLLEGADYELGSAGGASIPEPATEWTGAVAALAALAGGEFRRSRG